LPLSPLFDADTAVVFDQHCYSSGIITILIVGLHHHPYSYCPYSIGSTITHKTSSQSNHNNNSNQRVVVIMFSNKNSHIHPPAATVVVAQLQQPAATMVVEIIIKT
jgi:hypothetical protein